MAVSVSLWRRFYRGRGYNGSLVFYGEIRRHIGPDSRVLNLGAGPATDNRIRVLKGEVAEVVGADIDACVLTNPELDQAVLIEDGRIPVADETFDLIYSDYVFEHVAAPVDFLREAARVLKPGGSLFFRTPNANHYVAVIAALTPHAFHDLVANAARDRPAGSPEPWKTFYRMNRAGDLRRMGRQAGFSRLDLGFVEMAPTYMRFNSAAFLVGMVYERLVNRVRFLAPLRASLYGRFVKGDAAGPVTRWRQTGRPSG